MACKIQFIIISFIIICSCDSIKEVIEADYSAFEGFNYTAMRHGWQYENGQAWYRIKIPDKSELTLWCWCTFEGEKLTIDSVRVVSNQYSSTVCSEIELSDETMNTIENGVRFMEKHRLHFLINKSKEQIRCRMWVLGFKWVDICKYRRDYQAIHRATEFKIGDGWVLNISPPADWERYYLREFRQDNPD